MNPDEDPKLEKTDRAERLDDEIGGDWYRYNRPDNSITGDYQECNNTDENDNFLSYQGPSIVSENDRR